MWSNAAVSLWCDHVTASYTTTTTTTTADTKPQKQNKRHCPSESRPTKRRRPLTERSSNMLPPNWPTLPLHDTDARDPEATPTQPPARHPLNTIVPLPASHDPSQSPSRMSPTDPEATPSASIDSRGVKRKRARTASPSKQLEERQYARYPVAQGAVDNVHHVHPDIRDVVRRIRRIGRGKGVLPPRHAQWAEQLSGGDEELASDLKDGGDDRYGSLPPPQRMQRIVGRAAQNVAQGASEAAWNCNVHAFLLDEAWDGSSVHDDVEWHNVTTATIVPDHLPDQDTLSTADAKKVDFCIPLTLAKYHQLGQALFQTGLRYLNHTDCGPVRYEPIAVSIETKLPGAGGSDALVQLTTWASAQIKSLESLHRWAGGGSGQQSSMASLAAIPPLPLLVIQGHTWSMFFLEHHPSTNGATLWSAGQFASTETLQGAYRVVAALQVLMHWAVHVYQPWFEETFLWKAGFRPRESASA